MSRKDGKAKQLPPWLTGSQGEMIGSKRAPFTQPSVSLLTDPIFNELSPQIRHLYICMTAEAEGKRVFKFPRKAAIRYGFIPSTFREYVAVLIEKGFISRNSGWTTREPNIYQFEDTWKRSKPP